MQLTAVAIVYSFRWDRPMVIAARLFVCCIYPRTAVFDVCSVVSRVRCTVLSHSLFLSLLCDFCKVNYGELKTRKGFLEQGSHKDNFSLLAKGNF